MANNLIQPNTTLLTSSPVNWAETLAKYYDREAAQLEEHHRNLRERDRQMVEKAKAEDPVQTIKQVGDTVIALKQFSDSLKARSEKQKEKRKDKIREQIRKHPATFQLVSEQIQEYSDKKKDFLNSETGFQVLLNNAKKEAKDSGNYEILKDIKKWDPRLKVALREVLAQQRVFELNDPDLFIKYRSDNWDDAQQAWYNNTASASEKIEAKNLWKQEELEKFGITEGLAQTYLFGELNRQTETDRGIAGAKSAASFQQSRAIQAATTYGITANNANPLVLHENIKNEIVRGADDFTEITRSDGSVYTPIQQSRDRVLDDIRDLNLGGFIPQQALVGLEHFKFEHPAAGEDGATISTAFFDKDGKMYNQFVRENEIGQHRVISAKTALDNNYAEETKRLAHSGASQDQIDRRIRDLENRGLVSTETINALKKINVDAQTVDGEKIAREEWERKLATGLYNITQTDIDAIKNDKVKDEVQLRFNQLQDYIKKTGVNHIGTYDSTVTEVMTGSALGKDEKAPGLAGLISAQLDREAQTLFSTLVWAQYDDNGKLVQPNNDIAGTVTAYKDGLWTTRGGGTKNEDGLYSFNEQAKDFSNWRKHNLISRKASIQHKINWTPENDTKWKKDVDVLLNTTYKGNTKAAIADGAGLDKVDLAGVALTGDYSDKFYVVAERLNTDVNTLFTNAVKRLNDSDNPEDDQFTRSFGFEKLEKELKAGKNKTANDVILESLNLAYESVKGKPGFYNSRIGTLRYQLRTQGWKNLDTNRQIELIGILQKSVKADPEIQPLVQAKEEAKAAELLEINKQKAKARRERIMQGIQETEDERRGKYQ